MKKLLLLLLVVMIFVTGCGRPTIEEVAANIEVAKNYEATVNLKIDGKFEKEVIDYTREKYITVDNINSAVKVKAIVNLNDYKSHEVYYIKSNGENLSIYKKANGFYNYREEKKDMNSIYYITAFINKNSSYQFIDNKNGLTHYVITLNKERVKDFLSSYYDVEVLNGLDYQIKDSAKINIYVNNKTKCIDSLNVDFSNIIKFTNLSSYELDKFYLEINYDKFNESGDIKIPDEYLNNAIDVNIIDAYISAEKYVKKVNELNLSDKTTSYKNTKLIYLGEEPASVNFVIAKGKVISGDIIYDNYKFKIESGELLHPSKVIILEEESVKE